MYSCHVNRRVFQFIKATEYVLYFDAPTPAPEALNMGKVGKHMRWRASCGTLPLSCVSWSAASHPRKVGNSVQRITAVHVSAAAVIFILLAPALGCFQVSRAPWFPRNIRRLARAKAAQFRLMVPGDVSVSRARLEPKDEIIIAFESIRSAELDVWIGGALSAYSISRPF